VVAAALSSGPVCILDARAKALKEREKLLYKLTEHKQAVTAMVWDEQGRYLYTGDRVGIMCRTFCRFSSPAFSSSASSLATSALSSALSSALASVPASSSFSAKPEPIGKTESAVIQLAIQGDLLLFSSMTKSAVIDMSAKPRSSKQLGQKPR